MLLHLNPPWLPEQNDWDYMGKTFYTFASDEIFKKLSKHGKELFDMARIYFNC
jgi:hypothetical protein